MIMQVLYCDFQILRLFHVQCRMIKMTSSGELSLGSVIGIIKHKGVKKFFVQFWASNKNVSHLKQYTSIAWIPLKTNPHNHTYALKKVIPKYKLYSPIL